MIEGQAGLEILRTLENSAVATVAPHAHPVLPLEPVVRIRPESASVADNLREVWAHRELLYFLIWRDLKVRYKQTLFGVTWVILQPMLMALVFAVFMGRLARVPSDGVPYAVFAYAGLLPWLFFSNSLTSGSHSLVANSYVITKVYFPRLILPLAVVGVRLVDFLIAFLALFSLMFYYGIHPGVSVLVLPVCMVLLTLLAMGISIWFSALNAGYRDVGAVLPILLQLWMFVSPVIYPASLVPEQWRFLYSFNPASGIIEGFRSSLFGMKFNWQSLVISAVIIISSLIFFLYDFCRRQDNLVDII